MQASRVMSTDRVSWDTYFIRMASLVRERGTCNRLQVGCVLVRANRIIATGYNGAPSKTEHCTEVGHDLSIDGHCTRALHAETNALLHCAADGPPARGATAYVTAFPCWTCYMALVQAGIERIVYSGEYVDRAGARARVEQDAARRGLTIEMVSP